MSNIDDSSDEDIDVPTTEVQKPAGIGSLSGLGLALSQTGKTEKDKTEQELLGEEVTIIFQLESKGESKKHVVNMGRPVEWLKLLVEREYGINFESQKMFVGSKELANFFSLQDIKEIVPKAENVIIVKEL